MILCCGEALIDMLPVKTDNGTAYLPHPGGAVLNTARALGRLNVPAGIFTGLSTDMFGDRLREALHEAGVDTSLCAVSDRPTMLAFIDVKDAIARYSFHDEGTAGRMILSGDLPEMPPKPLPSFGFFGGISLVQEPMASTCEVLFHRFADAGVPLMLDPNIRPGFIRHERIYRKRLERMIEEVTILKLSDQDLDWLAGPGSVTQRCEALLARGPALVVVTEGARGARAHSASHEVFVAAPKCDVIDTVGAGDTFNAGLLASLSDRGLLSAEAIKGAAQHHLQNALKMAVSAAASSVTHEGAYAPTRAELV